MDVWLALCPKEKQKVTKDETRERKREGERERGERDTDRDRQTERGGSPNEYSNSTVNLNLYTLEVYFILYILCRQ